MLQHRFSCHKMSLCSIQVSAGQSLAWWVSRETETHYSVTELLLSFLPTPLSSLNGGDTRGKLSPVLTNRLQNLHPLTPIWNTDDQTNTACHTPSLLKIINSSLKMVHTPLEIFDISLLLWIKVIITNGMLSLRKKYLQGLPEKMHVITKDWSSNVKLVNNARWPLRFSLPYLLDLGSALLCTITDNFPSYHVPIWLSIIHHCLCQCQL
jgi:hypothetical protein